MSCNVAMLKAMQAEGLDLAACIRVLEAGEKKADPTNAERQARFRARRKQGKERNTRYSNGVTPPNDNTLTPSEVTEAKASSPQSWPCPEGVNPIHWRDFLKNRKTKHLTNSETAYHGQLRELAKISDEEWPPGRLVQHAAERGWGSICDPRKSRHGTSPNPGLSKSAAAFAKFNFAADEPF